MRTGVTAVAATGVAAAPGDACGGGFGVTGTATTATVGTGVDGTGVDGTGAGAAGNGGAFTGATCTGGAAGGLATRNVAHARATWTRSLSVSRRRVAFDWVKRMRADVRRDSFLAVFIVLQAFPVERSAARLELYVGMTSNGATGLVRSRLV